ncbi:MAG: pyrrolo-quinoline quinone [Verrucomicrobiota bacterium]|nr:pyrrolo-quinoline quinone [Verrucomicrobiota bacterium]
MATGVALVTSVALARAVVDVVTWHGDAARTGLNANEKFLTTSNVNASSFGKLFNITVDGKVDVQPLYLSFLNIQGALHNVVIIATEHDSIYAADADTGTIYWQKTMLPTGEVPSDDRGCSQVTPEIGITGTPAIDRNQGTNGTIYLIAMSKDGSGVYHQRLHALDLTTGVDLQTPVEVVASYPGTGDNSSGGTVFFDSKQYKARPGLVDYNGNIYTYWGSHCDFRPYTGWIISYDKNTLAQTSVLDLAPNGNDNSLWNSGAAPALDPSGNQYQLVANGSFETTLDGNGFPSGQDFGNCYIKLSSMLPIKVTDYWTMFNTVSESDGDQDLGSGGAMVLPDMTDAGGHIRHLTVGAGKDTHIYLADRDNMGKFNSASNSTLYQDLGAGVIQRCFSSPAYFNGHVYFGGVTDNVKEFTFTNARLSATPTSKSAVTFPYPGTTPTISANGTGNAIVWCMYNGTTAALYAYDATNLASRLYTSNDASGSRDNFGAGNKFIVPTVANGKVFAATTNSVAVFGLLNPPQPVSVRAKSIARNGSSVTVTIDGTTNFEYQLQRAGSLPSAFSNIGTGQTGTTGSAITFTDNSPPAGMAFYRIVVGP